MEIEYVRYLLGLHSDCLFVAKVGREFILFDSSAVSQILSKIESGYGWGLPSPIDAIRLKLNWQQRSARSFVRKCARVKVPLAGLARLFEGVDLGTYQYLNIGHSNLSNVFFQSLRSAGCKRIRVFVHDMIPLDYPAFSQAHIPAAFALKMKATAAWADDVICNSQATRKSVERYFTKWGASPSYTVSHLGIEPMLPDDEPQQNGEHPYFVVLGTIEPRKNHQLLFSVWDRLSKAMPAGKLPYLIIVGRRGWRNTSVFKLLDSAPIMGKSIFEKPDLSDRDLAKLLQNTAGLLFPSFAEGFGLPGLEAAQLGAPVLCSDIDVFHEILGGYAQFLDPNNVNDWSDAVIELLQNRQLRQKNNSESEGAVSIPTWKAHFCHVFKQS